MQALPVDPSEQLSDSISTCDVNKGLLFVCFIFLFCFFFVHFFPFLGIVFVSTVEFRYYVVVILLVDLGKP